MDSHVECKRANARLAHGVLRHHDEHFTAQRPHRDP
jgi:hypothetical protein